MATSSPTLPLTVPSTVDGAIDIPATLAADDATLTAAIELARQWMRDLRRNRSSLAFADAKTADTVLTRERALRQVARYQSASPAPAPRLHPCNTSCVAGRHPIEACSCECRGANHARADKQPGPSGRTGFDRLPAIDDSEF